MTGSAPPGCAPCFAINRAPGTAPGSRMQIAKLGKTYASFDEAEKVARANLARGSDRTAILYVDEPWRHDAHRYADVAAFVRADALGRVWTDLQAKGATLV